MIAKEIMLHARYPTFGGIEGFNPKVRISRHYTGLTTTWIDCSVIPILRVRLVGKIEEAFGVKASLT